jgi:NADH:ubiquinone oxidoreductase subunit F (NADH-binding)
MDHLKNPLTANIRPGKPPFSLKEYEQAGGYQAVRKALHSLTPGEVTALLNSLEGRRAVPRAKPLFPPVVGLWGKPTTPNNVETISNVPHIVNHGAAWFKGLSHSPDGGTKIYGVSGRVERPGAWELPMGTTLREILKEQAGRRRMDLGGRAPHLRLRGAEHGDRGRGRTVPAALCGSECG